MHESIAPATQNRLSILDNLTMRAVAIGVATGLMLSACSGGSHGEAKPTDSDKTELGCDTSTLGNPGADASLYATDAFLPHTDKLAGNDDVKTYIDSFFDANGPLGTSIDKGSLAAVTALISRPAHDGVATDPTYSYLGAFRDAFTAYSAATGGLAAAEADCRLARDTMAQTAEFNGNWAQQGETITQAIAGRNAKNEPTALELKQVVTGETLKGIHYMLRGSAKGIDGFTDVLLTSNGEMYMKGLTTGQLGRVELETGSTGTTPAEGPTGTDSKTTGGAANGSANTGEKQTGTCGSCGASTGGSGGGVCTSCGTGTGTGTGNGGTGTGTGTGGGGTGTGGNGGGTGGGGGNGGGSGGGESTTTTTAPKPTTTTTVPRTTTTTTPPTTTTTIPSKKPPITCDPNIDVC